MVRALTLAAGALLAAACATRGGLVVDPLAKERGLYAAGRYPAVVAALTPDRLARLPRRAQADGRVLLAGSLERAGRLDDALAAYQYAADLFPRNLEVVSGLAWLLHRQALDDRARPLFEGVLRIHPKNASANLGQAEILRAQGDLAAAQGCYETALAEPGWDKNAAIWRDYAEVAADRQRFETAAAAVRRSLQLEASADTLLVAARVERRQGHAADGYSRLEESLKADPGRREARLERALWLLEDGRLADAETDAQAVLAQDADALALWVRGAARARSGDIPGARADLAAAAAQGRTHPFVARAALALLQELHAPAD